MTKKPAITGLHSQGIVDDIVKGLAKKISTSAGRKGAKAFVKMEKTAAKAGGSIRKSVNAAENTPRKLVKEYERNSKKMVSSYARSNKYGAVAKKAK